MSGAFKFDPKTIELLKNNYPTAYAYLVEAKIVEPGNILELTESQTVIDAIITNTDYHQAYLNKEKAINGLGRLTRSDADLLMQEGTQKLIKEDIVSAFTSGFGPEIQIVPKPEGFDGASGYNLGNDGKNYSTPIILHEGLFAALENASSQEDKEAALLNLTSVLLHEFVEDFADDNRDVGNGSYGARVLQYQLYLGESPTIFDKYNSTEIDNNFTVAKSVIKRLREGEGDASVIPTLPKKKD